MTPEIKGYGPQPASILIVGDFPSESDKYDGAAFSGGSGWEFSKMLQEAGILRTACRLTMAYRVRPPAGSIEHLVAPTKAKRTPSHVYWNGQWVIPEVMDELAALEAEIQATAPTIIIACGSFALWALTGKWGASKWRGSCLETSTEFTFSDGSPTRHVKVIPTHTPGEVMSQWKLRPIVLRDLRRAKDESATPLYNRPNYDFLTRPTYEATISRLDGLYRRVQSGPLKLSVDVETRAGYLACVGIADSKTSAICIPLMTRTDSKGYWTLEQEAEISWRLYRLLNHTNALIVGQNFIYDIQYFHRHLFFMPTNVRDTMLAQHACFSTMPKGLDFLASMYAAHYVYWKDEGKEWNPNDKSTEDEFWNYNCLDAVYTYEVDEVLQRVTDQMGMREVSDFQQSMFPLVLKTMNRGVLIDAKMRSEVSAKLNAEKKEIQAWINEAVGHPLNLQSPKQLTQFFYKDLNLPLVTKRGTGKSSTDEAALEKIASREPLMKPLVDKIIEFRQASKTLANSIDVKISEDGRMRCSYNIAGTDTFRFNSRADAFGDGTNLQNQPAKVKGMFIPDPGMTFFDMDLDSADLRIVVAESGEENMAEWLDAGLKPYVMVMQEYYHDTSLTKAHDQYRIFKALCHGTHYLGQPPGLAAQTGLQVSEVERIQAWYFKRFPKIKQWQDRFKARIDGRKQCTNIFGNRLLILDRITTKVYNEAIAWVPQSTVALLINRIWKNIDAHIPQVEILLQTHDSLSGQFPTSQTEACIEALRQQSQIILPYPKPIIIPTGFKTSTKSYGDC